MVHPMLGVSRRGIDDQINTQPAYISSNIQTTQPKVARRFRRLCEVIEGVAHTSCCSPPELSVIGLDLLQLSVYGSRSGRKCKECGVLGLEGSRNA